MIPHFEKMLSDNAQLITIYCQAMGLSANKYFLKDRALQTLQWVMRDMRSADGVFSYTSMNADSEGVEGKFYCWDRQDVRRGVDQCGVLRDGGNFQLMNRQDLTGIGIFTTPKIRIPM